MSAPMVDGTDRTPAIGRVGPSPARDLVRRNLFMEVKAGTAVERDKFVMLR